MFLTSPITFVDLKNKKRQSLFKLWRNKPLLHRARVELPQLIKQPILILLAPKPRFRLLKIMACRHSLSKDVHKPMARYSNIWPSTRVQLFPTISGPIPSISRSATCLRQSSSERCPKFSSIFSSIGWPFLQNNSYKEASQSVRWYLF